MNPLLVSLHELKREFRHALKGESRYRCILSGYEDSLNKLVLEDIFAVSDLAAVAKAARLKSDFVIRSIRHADSFISIKLLVAYPCRLASLIFADVKRRDREFNDMSAVLLLQSRQAMVKHIDGKASVITWPRPADAAVFSAIPDDNAQAACFQGNVVDGNVHDFPFDYTARKTSASLISTQPGDAITIFPKRKSGIQIDSVMISVECAGCDEIIIFEPEVDDADKSLRSITETAAEKAGWSIDRGTCGECTARYEAEHRRQLEADYQRSR
jgi:hypothetical protein